MAQWGIEIEFKCRSDRLPKPCYFYCKMLTLLCIYFARFALSGCVWVCVSVCVCVCARACVCERQRERERDFYLYSNRINFMLLDSWICFQLSLLQNNAPGFPNQSLSYRLYLLVPGYSSLNWWSISLYLSFWATLYFLTWRTNCHFTGTHWICVGVQP